MLNELTIKYKYNCMNSYIISVIRCEYANVSKNIIDYEVAIIKDNEIIKIYDFCSQKKLNSIVKRYSNKK